MDFICIFHFPTRDYKSFNSVISIEGDCVFLYIFQIATSDIQEFE